MSPSRVGYVGFSFLDQVTLNPEAEVPFVSHEISLSFASSVIDSTFDSGGSPLPGAIIVGRDSRQKVRIRSSALFIFV